MIELINIFMLYIILSFLLGTLAGGAFIALRSPSAAGGGVHSRPAAAAAALTNGVLWALCVFCLAPVWDAVLCCALSSVLLIAALTDARIGEIPPLCSLSALLLGILRLFLDLSCWQERLIGFAAVSAPLLLLLLLSHGRAVGGGDVKLLAGCGLFLGWKLILAAFLLACILGSLVHLIRMRFFGAGRSLALGPYLSAAVFICALWGNALLNAYLRLFIPA